MCRRIVINIDIFMGAGSLISRKIATGQMDQQARLGIRGIVEELRRVQCLSAHPNYGTSMPCYLLLSFLLCIIRRCCLTILLLVHLVVVLTIHRTRCSYIVARSGCGIHAVLRHMQQIAVQNDDCTHC